MAHVFRDSNTPSVCPRVMLSSRGTYCSSCKLRDTKTSDVLTVFQAAPLAYEDSISGALVPLGKLDFEQERRVLESVLRDAQVDIELAFCIATADRLGSFLTRQEGRVLHFSGHGHEQFLAIENGSGKMQPLEVENLRKWIVAGGAHLQFVFVSACFSRQVGEAFIEAGVPHVVCCKHNDSALRDVAAGVFSKAFYEALACGKTLAVAFELGRRRVENTPKIPDQDRDAEVSKFVLLPEHKDHNVQLFARPRRFQQPFPITTLRRSVSSGSLHSITEKPLRRSSSPASIHSMPEMSLRRSTSSESIHSQTELPLRGAPPPPDNFVGRQVDVYKLLESVRMVKTVRICGMEGIGKVSVVQDACRYMSERPDSFPHKVVWLNSDDLYGENEDVLSMTFSRFFRNIGSRPEDSLDSLQTDATFLRCRTMLAKNLCKERYMLVLEMRALLLPGSSVRHVEMIASILKYLTLKSPARAVVIHDSPAASEATDEVVRSSAFHVNLVLKPLDFRSTIFLFGRLCRHVSERRCPDIGNYMDLALLLLPPDDDYDYGDEPRSLRCQEIFKMIGEGIPKSIHEKANTMSDEDYDRLILLGRREEKVLEFSTRAEFDERMVQVNADLYRYVEMKDFVKAQECKELLDEMAIIEEALPTVDMLVSVRDSTQLDLDLAIQRHDFVSAGKLQGEVDALEAKISAERSAASVSANAKLRPRTRAEVCSEIFSCETQLTEASDKNDFAQARRLDVRLNKLERERDSMPSVQELRLQVSELETKLRVEKVQRNWDEAQRVYSQLQQTQSRLAIEHEAEVELGLTVQQPPLSEETHPMASAPFETSRSEGSAASLTLGFLDTPPPVGAIPPLAKYPFSHTGAVLHGAKEGRIDGYGRQPSLGDASKTPPHRQDERPSNSTAEEKAKSVERVEEGKAVALSAHMQRMEEDLSSIVPPLHSSMGDLEDIWAQEACSLPDWTSQSSSAALGVTPPGALRIGGWSTAGDDSLDSITMTTNEEPTCSATPLLEATLVVAEPVHAPQMDATEEEETDNRRNNRRRRRFRFPSILRRKKSNK